jgi:hypothetical protein
VFSKKILINELVEKEVRFFSEQITISGSNDSISKGLGEVLFSSKGQLANGDFVFIQDHTVKVDLLKVVQSTFTYDLGGVTETMTGVELLTAMKAVYEKALKGEYN